MAAGIVTSCGKKSEDNENKDSVRVEQVKVTTLKTQEINRIVDISTTLDGWETVNIAPTIQGHIEKLYVDVDSKVGAGQMLVKMDETQYNNIKLAFANLKIEFARMEALKKTGSVSQQTYDQTKLQLDQTKENLDFLTKNTFVRAPFSGVISAKNYEDGELYSGQPILVLTQIDRLKALIAIPESYIPQVKTGMKLTLRSDVYPDKEFPATIEIVYPTVDATSHTFQAKVVMQNNGGLLRPGMYVTANLALGTEAVITAPYSAVLKLIGANDRYVFVNDNGVARRVTVEMGQRFGDDVEIFGEGIEPGVELVTKGEARLIDGVKLDVKNK